MREGESYNDILGRAPDEDEGGYFYDGFGRWLDGKVECVREQREHKEERKARMRRLAGGEGKGAGM